MNLPPRLEYLSQAILPTRWLSTAMHRFTQIRNPLIKNATINVVLKQFAVNMAEAVEENPHAYGSFNEFFTRELKAELRPLAPEPAILSPVDGTISQWGAINGNTIFQAKGRSFTAPAVLGDASEAPRYLDGQFATIYLAPNNYHRIHMPLAARLIKARYIPGRLFSVQPSTAQAIDGLFARNERLVLHFEAASGPFALVLVGALFVGSMETVMHGKVSPPHSRSPRDFDHQTENIHLERGQELGRFNMGSTVILLFPPGSSTWDADLGPGQAVQMGQSLGNIA